MNQQELEAKLEQAETLFRETFVRAYLAEWWSEVIDRREHVTPSDWLNVALIQIEMLIDAQGLDTPRRESLVFDVTAELHKRLSKANPSTDKV